VKAVKDLNSLLVMEIEKKVGKLKGPCG
jgi:hypothetical protein